MTARSRRLRFNLFVTVRQEGAFLGYLYLERSKMAKTLCEVHYEIKYENNH